MRGRLCGAALESPTWVAYSPGRSLTGGEAISEEVGLELENADPSLLGRARGVVVTEDETTTRSGTGAEASR